jgi:hypothetical protein
MDGKRQMQSMVSRIVAALLLILAGAPALAQQGATPNNTPLIFGMSVEQASQALGATLSPVRGPSGGELYVALSNVKGAALSHRNDALYLQFRRGRLQGWKGDWGANRPPNDGWLQ